MFHKLSSFFVICFFLNLGRLVHVFGVFEGIHVTQRHLGEQHDANVIVRRSEAVVGRLTRHICKVDPLSKLNRDRGQSVTIEFNFCFERRKGNARKG